jgi:hypothetical protein
MALLEAIQTRQRTDTLRRLPRAKRDRNTTALLDTARTHQKGKELPMLSDKSSNTHKPLAFTPWEFDACTLNAWEGYCERSGGCTCQQQDAKQYAQIIIGKAEGMSKVYAKK